MNTFIYSYKIIYIGGSKHGLKLNDFNTKIMDHPLTLVVFMTALEEKEIEELLIEALGSYLYICIYPYIHIWIYEYINA
jgi:hypothetical protein